MFLLLCLDHIRCQSKGIWSPGSAAHPETQKHLHQCPHCCWQHLQGVVNQWDTIWDQQSNTISNAAFAWSLLRGARKLQPKQLLAQHHRKQTPNHSVSSLSQEQGRCDLNYFLLVHVGSCWFGVPSMTKEKSKPAKPTAPQWLLQ